MSQHAEDSDIDRDDGLQWLLGFVETPRNAYELLRHHFPSKVGGRPAWLDPVHLPTIDQLHCPITKTTMKFLMQVYAPVDENPTAFHRCMYIFISPDGSQLRNKGSVRAWRCQLPRRNEFYGYDPPKKDSKTPPPLPHKLLETSLSRDPWKVEEDQGLGMVSSVDERVKSLPGSLPSLFPENELVVEPEPEESSASQQTSQQERIDRYVQWEQGAVEEDLPADAVDALEQATTLEQRHFAAFAARIAREPAQVLRYCFEEGARPLCPRPDGEPSATDIPPCPLCKGPRRFEFQVMPQLLNHLGVDAADPNAPDWGTVAVYSCAASCAVNYSESGTTYQEEWVWVQPPV